MTSTLKINTIEPEGATTTLAVGESGQNIVIAGAGLKANTLKDAGTRTITKFTTVETTSWTAPTGVTSVDYLVVAGGGGSEYYAGGGGAGGMLTGTLTVVPSTSYTVTVGAGGDGATDATQGGNSVFSTITSTGGGKGNSTGAGGDGGSGAGGSSGVAAEGGSGVTGQGNAGGKSNAAAGGYATGGGGGAGSAGGDATSNVCGFGGQGVASSITGDEVYYAGGGGGGLQLATTSSAYPMGRGGRGGGGVGAAGAPDPLAGTDGAPNTGSGGGGGSGGGVGGGAGGSGIVILSYTGATAVPNTIFVSDGSGNLSSVNAGFSAAPVLIQTQIASSASLIAFTSGIDSTYDEYIWRFYGIHVNTDATFFQFQLSDDGGASYGVTKTTTYFGEEQNEIDTSGSITYEALYDLPTGGSDAGATNAQYLARESGNAADESCAGELHLFNPGSSSYYKQFYAFVDNAYNAGYIMAGYIGGYARVFTPINAIKFTTSSGTFNGTIKMYGIK